MKCIVWIPNYNKGKSCAPCKDILLPDLLGVIYFGGEPSLELVLDNEDLKLDRRLATGSDDDDLGVAAIGILSSFKYCSVCGGGWC